LKQIFLISGKAQHGKDSVANFLKQKLIGKTLIIHNADILKYIAKQYLEWDGNKDVAGRTLLQQLGTEQVRFGLKRPMFWTEKTCDTIEILQSYFDYFCVPDTRFANEVFYPQARFPGLVITIRVNRLNFDNGMTQEQKNHQSEIELDDFHFDYYISSPSGLSYLEEEVDNFIKIFYS